MDVTTRFDEIGSFNIHGVPQEEIKRLAKQFNCFLEHYKETVGDDTRSFDCFTLKLGKTDIKFFS